MTPLACAQGWMFLGGMAFSVGIAALVGLVLLIAAESDWKGEGRTR